MTMWTLEICISAQLLYLDRLQQWLIAVVEAHIFDPSPAECEQGFQLFELPYVRQTDNNLEKGTHLFPDKKIHKQIHTDTQLKYWHQR